jgi:hypothetical protein
VADGLHHMLEHGIEQLLCLLGIAVDDRSTFSCESC